MSCAVDTAQWQNWQLPCFSELNMSSIMELPKDSLISMYAGINFVAQKQSWELQGIIVTTTKQLCFSYVQKYHFIYELKCIACAVDTAQWQNWQLPCFLELNMSSIMELPKDSLISMYAGINFCRTKQSWELQGIDNEVTEVQYSGEIAIVVCFICGNHQSFQRKSNSFDVIRSKRHWYHGCSFVVRNNMQAIGIFKRDLLNNSLTPDFYKNIN